MFYTYWHCRFKCIGKALDFVVDAVVKPQFVFHIGAFIWSPGDANNCASQNLADLPNGGTNRSGS